MKVDGKAIAGQIFSDLREKIQKENLKPVLGVIYVGSNPVIDNFVSLKKKKGEESGVKVEILRYGEDASEEELISAIDTEAEKYNGMIVQLPLPKRFSAERVLNAIPPELDVDVLSANTLQAFSENKTKFIPAVVGAIEEILKNQLVDLSGKNIAVIGSGKLVGYPAQLWLKKSNLSCKVLDENNDLSKELENVDVIISGAGVPGLIQPSFIKEGVVLLDAGTSEKEGKVKGDADPNCAEKCSLFTPVPGGIGPITVAVLFRNLVQGM